MTRFRLIQLLYDARTSLLVIPFSIALAMGLVGVGLAQAETRAGLEIAWLAIEPSSAQTTLATLAGSMMSVVSVVYSVLVVALTLASMQFSTRVLSGMVRDRLSQVVLGVFVGTFTWQLVALRSVRLDPPYVPPITVSVAVLLALVALGALILFIDRMIHGIQANHLVARIALETEAVIDETCRGERATSEPTVSPDARTVRAVSSGYVQLVDVEAVLAVAPKGSRIQLLRPIGTFVPEGAALWAVSPAAVHTDALGRALVHAVDVGPIRTMQQDVEWGFRQLVDIGLKAISPAVNDPSTAATCIDHLSRLLIRVGARGAPRSTWVGSGTVILPQAGFPDLVDLSFEQLRQYGRQDMAIALRLLRALIDVAENTDDERGRERIRVHARHVERAARAAFPDDCEELDRRWERLSAVLSALPADPPSVASLPGV